MSDIVQFVFTYSFSYFLYLNAIFIYSADHFHFSVNKT